jgi:hypothetical protein
VPRGLHPLRPNSRAGRWCFRSGVLTAGRVTEQVVAPNHAPNVSMPLWQLPPGRTNLPAALALFAYHPRV